MHELSLAGAIVNTAEKHARGRRVEVVNLRVGRLRQVVPESLEFYFGFVSKGTLCEGAALRQDLIPGRLRCGCGQEWTLELPLFKCPECGRVDVEVISGDEFEVDTIELEEETLAPSGEGP